jgi:molybdenum cofactor cytidylyltransferase
MASQPPQSHGGPGVAAILLAAGEGRRMGATKALVQVGGVSLLERCLALLDRPAIGLRIAVTGFEAERVERQVPAGVVVVRNPWPHMGMLSSLLVGLAEVERRGAAAVLVHLVDHPFASPATVDRVAAALIEGATIAVPSHEGHRGHPVGFARQAWPALRAAPASRGARAVLADHPEWVTYVAGDPGCLADMDTPADLAGWQGRSMGSPSAGPEPSDDAPGQAR